MQIIGLASVVLFLGALAALLAGFMNDNFMKTGGIIGVICLALATLLLGVTIRQRNKTERI